MIGVLLILYILVVFVLGYWCGWGDAEDARRKDRDGARMLEVQDEATVEESQGTFVWVLPDVQTDQDRVPEGDVDGCGEHTPRSGELLGRTYLSHVRTNTSVSERQRRGRSSTSTPSRVPGVGPENGCLSTTQEGNIDGSRCAYNSCGGSCGCTCCHGCIRRLEEGEVDASWNRDANTAADSNHSCRDSTTALRRIVATEWDA